MFSQEKFKVKGILDILFLGFVLFGYRPQHQFDFDPYRLATSFFCMWTPQSEHKNKYKYCMYSCGQSKEKYHLTDTYTQ